MEYIYSEIKICMCCGKKIRFWQTYHVLGANYIHCKCNKKKDRDYLIGKRYLDSQNVQNASLEDSP